MNRRELTHLWAAQSRPQRKAGSISFVGPTLYSYSTGIAHIHKNKAGESFVLMCQKRYSMTTACHKSAARSAVSHLPFAEVPHILPASAKEHGENLEAILADSREMLAKAQRALRWRQWQQDSANELYWTAEKYAEFFRVRHRIPPFPVAEWNAAAARAARIENPDPASADKRERQRAQRAAAKEARERKARELAAVHDAARRSDWRLFGAFGASGMMGHFVRNSGPIMLRVNGEEIETSMGARIPLAAAPMVWNLVQRVRIEAQHAPDGAGRSFANGLRRVRIGDYPLDRIDADGTLHAGCHTIPYSELAAMARTLGLE